ncbi:helix-turn-helix domain-containing protein [Sutcliffiella horikoshii]|uniref:helix-turn-helix domain-containing protein n=1 Tax=Sutcliffiella horikoshii TaxID=79883 RepID=UPI003CEC5E41
MIGKRLKELRGKRSQEEVAEKIGISRARLSHYETGRSEPDSETLQNIADFYDVPIDYLITGEDRFLTGKPEDSSDDPEFMHAMRSAKGFSKENKQKLLDYIEMIEELEKGRKPGDKQTRRNK